MPFLEVTQCPNGVLCAFDDDVKPGQTVCPHYRYCLERGRPVWDLTAAEQLDREWWKQADQDATAFAAEELRRREDEDAEQVLIDDMDENDQINPEEWQQLLADYGDPGRDDGVDEQGRKCPPEEYPGETMPEDWEKLSRLKRDLVPPEDQPAL